MSFSRCPTRCLTRSLTTMISRTLAPSFVAVLMFTLLQASVATAQLEANFWLSNAENGPAAPTLYVAPNSIQTLDVWGRPEAGNSLNAISLNLFAEQADVISFQDVVVQNPEIEADLYRHQLVFDSAAGLILQPNLIRGFLGFSFFDGGMGLLSGIGIGPSCGQEDAFYCSEQQGGPAWRFATVTFQVGAAVGVATDLYLEIGKQGVVHNNDTPIDTQVVFGLPSDMPNFWDAKAMEGMNHLGTYDARIIVASADFDDDDDVDGADFLIWQRGLGVGSTLSEGDANGDSLVDTVDLSVWESQWGTSAAAVAAAVEIPEPATCFLLQTAVFSIWLQRWHLKKGSCRLRPRHANRRQGSCCYW